MVATGYPPDLFGSEPFPTISLYLEEFDVETEALQLADQHVERLRQARGFRHVALDDRFVDLAPPFHVVALDRQQLLQGVGGAVGFQRPDLHLAEALAAELRLAAQRLLGDQRVRSDRARVNLVVDQVRKLEHVDVSDRDLLLERVADHAVVERRLARQRQVGLGQQVLDVLLVGAVEDRRREAQAERLAGPPEVGLEDLADVHAAGHAERVEHDLDRGAVRQVGHVLLGQDARDHALVAVPSGHLVADLQLALHGDVDLDQLDDPGRQLVALLQQADALLVDAVEHLDVRVGLAVDDLHRVEQPLLVDRQAHDLLSRQPLEDRLGDRRAGLEQLLAGARLDRGGDLLAVQQVADLLVALLGQDPHLVLDVLLQPGDLLLLDVLRPLVLLDALAREDLDVDDRALDPRRHLEAGVAHVAGLLAEDGAQQLLFGSELGLALRRHLADQDVAGLDGGADAHDAALVEVLERGLRDVRDVARDLLGAELGVARLDLELLDVDRGVVILAHQLLRDQDRVLEVVAAPGHERDQHVAAQGQLALVGARAVGQHVALLHPLPLADHRLLGDAGVLVRAPELDQ